jgi:cell division protein ZapE
MTPLDYYQQQANSGLITLDQNQMAVMQHLQQVYFQLIQENASRQSLLSFMHKQHLAKSVYLYGGVGIGKTFMMDCFYKALPFQKKLRMHFHQFMQLIHHKLRDHQGEADPLRTIAKEISQQTLVLCFDELFVSDITDAMLLGRLFKALFDRKVCLIATSNSAPDDLYKNGLQRINFLPAIALLKNNMDVIHVEATVDYRLRHLKEAGVFYTPLNEIAQQKMEKAFASLAQGKDIIVDPINVCNRLIPIQKRTEDTVWFEFQDICHIPRSQQDYLVISEKYKTVFISNIPIIEETAKDTICLFISLIDVLYDARVRLVVSSAEPIENIYHRGYKIAEFTRTHSRLLEMQSHDYFAGNE